VHLTQLKATSVFLALFATTAQAQNVDTGRNAYGMPGLIDMPSALSFPDADLSVTSSRFQVESRTSLAFQITPRLTGSFRYSFIGAGFTYDRSFALQYRLIDEGRYRPAFAIGVNDIIGTGQYSGEYVVATKSVGPNLRFSAGMGWGRLGSYNGFANPLGTINKGFETRPARAFGQGGNLELDQWFRGDAAMFGGVEWQVNDRLRVMAEYSSDAYPFQDGKSFDRATPLNFGLSYAVTPRWTVDARYLYGSELGLQATFAMNPKDRPKFGAGFDPAPPPVRVRGQQQLAATEEPLETRLKRDLSAQGIVLNGVSVQGGTATVEVANNRYSLDAQAVGRTARVLTRQMPDSVDRFAIILARNGMPVTSVMLSRDDLEGLEFDRDGTEFSIARATLRDTRTSIAPMADRYPRWGGAIEPYLRPSYFDPDAPIRADLGVAIGGVAEPLPGLRFAGRIERKLVGTLNSSTRASDSVLPHVRTDSNIYDREGETALTELTGAYFFRPAPQVFGRVTVGYLERMFAGVSTEVLWKPDGKRYALGADVNYVVQRDFDQGFGLRDYSVVTGQVSGYYELPKDYHVQLDVGRYLAGDYGATMSLEREFENGWRVGAFATLTDVPFNDFGEGSFDKGITLAIPLDWVTGRPTQRKSFVPLRPIQRDGGAKLSVSGRLYEEVRGAKNTSLLDGWGRFWQ
jgi:opacity protein-like surface antigen